MSGHGMPSTSGRTMWAGEGAEEPHNGMSSAHSQFVMRCVLVYLLYVFKMEYFEGALGRYVGAVDGATIDTSPTTCAHTIIV